MRPTRKLWEETRYAALVCVDHWEVLQGQVPHPQGGIASRFGFRRPPDCDEDCNRMWLVDASALSTE